MIVGIGGASRSGKSSLAYALKKGYQEFSISIISQDDYVHIQNEIPKIKDVTDWECPASINLESFQRAISYASVNYDITIVEGLLVFHFPELISLFDKKIFIEIDKTTFLKRKADDMRWGEIPSWYKDHIWNSYKKYGKLNRNETNALFLNGSDTIEIKTVQHYLNFPVKGAENQ